MNCASPLSFIARGLLSSHSASDFTPRRLFSCIILRRGVGKAESHAGSFQGRAVCRARAKAQWLSGWNDLCTTHQSRSSFPEPKLCVRSTSTCAAGNAAHAPTFARPRRCEPGDGTPPEGSARLKQLVLQRVDVQVRHLAPLRLAEHLRELVLERLRNRNEAPI